MFLGDTKFRNAVDDIASCKNYKCMKKKLKQCKNICTDSYKGSQCELVCDGVGDEMIKAYMNEYQIFGRYYIPSSPINFNNI